MKNFKKASALILAVITAVVVFTACSTDKSFKDGTYRAEYSEADSHGWKDYLVVTVTDSKISEVDYDSLDADGNRKSESEDYGAAMKDGGNATWPSDFVPKLEKALIEKQDAEKIDEIAGATNSSDSMKNLFKKLKGNMEKGDTSTVKIEEKSK